MTETPNENNTVVLGGAALGADPVPTQTETQNALPIGTRMGEFEIIGLVGEGGFGIVYLAQDHSLERKVALKEYMPASLASRGSNATVSVRSERLQETFEIGRRSFVNEARLLAQFDHPSLVKVYRFWEANGTAYMAMPYYDGTTLRDTLHHSPQPPDEAWLKRILNPVTEALATIHAHNCFHRDIAPDNIMLLRDGRPVLLDFGAARRVIGDMTQALTVILKPGYAPIEQYAEMPNMRQGAWTDIYALAAVVYYAVSKRLPPPSVSRIMQDNYEPLAEIAQGRYSETFLNGVDRCLIVRPELRPQSIAEMRELLGLHLETTSTQSTAAATQILITMPEIDAPPSPAAASTTPAQKTPAATPPRHAPQPAPRVDKAAPETRAPAPTRSGLLIGGIAALLLCLGGAGAGWYFLSHRSAAPLAGPIATGGNAAADAAQSSVLSPSAVTSPAQIPTPGVSDTAAPSNLPQAAQSQAEARLEPIQDSPDKTPPAGSATSRKSTHSPATRAATNDKPAHQGTDNSERDYMHKLNKDLDDMLR